MKTGMIVQVVKGVVLSYVISILILLILSFVMFQWDVSEGVVRGGIIFTYVFSCFLGGMIISKNHSGHRYLWGMLQGGAYYIVLFITSMICNRAMFTSIPGILPALFLCVFGGMLGGMLQAGRK